jgi:chromosome segregation ATPase
VYADLQILEQQRQESERKLASARLLQKQKKAEQYTQERKLCELKSQVGGLRVELQRFNSQLSIRHRELLEIQMKAENSRKDTHRFDAKLKRVIGVARSLGTYRNKINNALIVLNESETRLNFTKGQEVSKLQSSRLRLNDVRRRRELLLQAIHANNVKARSIAEDISKIRANTVMIEQDLSEAQQTESQTKLRVETIEHEVMLERTRHTEAMTNLESKSTELNESKDKTIQSIANKKAMIEAKKAELRAMWEQCNQLRKSEDHDGMSSVLVERYGVFILPHFMLTLYLLLIICACLIDSLSRAKVGVRTAAISRRRTCTGSCKW